ncbi:MAG: hypothetical protein EBY92_04740 [Actinobacteria bacterium]|nr:hypothetical protein [Actinomycetota bacterium]
MLTMSMTVDQPTPHAAGAADQSLSVGDYAKLDFTAPATVGVVLYESQRLCNFLQGEVHRSEKSLRADMAARDASLREAVMSTEASLRADMAAMEKSLRADMAAMEKSLRAEMAANTRLLLTVMISLHGITLAAVAAMVRFW